ncbi:hypothetical protein OAH97_01350 [Octadecabacter sp.]|nr:hypothetical protein [Octadecabacter sp.]
MKSSHWGICGEGLESPAEETLMHRAANGGLAEQRTSVQNAANDREEPTLTDAA